ncbi:hypothetical protein [Echinicola rosea]|uniref:HAD-IIIC family phosphatase n=1 Tax=Echinicola rosea TaxID=1807691 RepID=A0ABQ1VBP4_9BACT|nr:hypothetical protein [Echinicola rosea]GGF46329.1 hypothetical protein GCM10011339_38550 [Echinicola rosea]
METLLLQVESIKLIIWDLDETFWQGTLSEEGIIPIPENIELVKKLSKRGIINSIVSKNDYDVAKQKLQELGVWDYFVFPAIDWSPKGVLIRNIIENCQLRSPNVLFLDDNHSNLEEARFYNPCINAHFPDFIEQIDNHEAFEGKDDTNLSRLKQYKILEKKHEAKKSYDDNMDFLKSSGIQVELIHDLSPHQDRLHELLQRTNQLNFTKVRLSQEQTAALIDSSSSESALVKVRDNFGEYGIIGFYSLDKTCNRLSHFVFSCRILNLGIPQYLYAKLGFPELHVVPEVAEVLDRSEPDWIEEISTSTPSPLTGKIASDHNQQQLYFRGPCDYKQTLFYLSNSGFKITQETNYVSSNIPVYPTHTQALLGAIQLSGSTKKQVYSIPGIPFFDQNYFETNLLKNTADSIVIALEADYYQHIYQHKQSGTKLALGKREGILTETANHSSLIKYFKERGADHFDEKVLKDFKAHFEHLGLISPKDFHHHLLTIRKLIPKQKQLILINAPTPSFKEEKRYASMNQVVDDFVKSAKNTKLVDLRKLQNVSTSTSEATAAFHRKTYLDIANLLLDLVPSTSDGVSKRKIGLFLVLKNEVRMRYLSLKSMLRKNIWKKAKRLNFLFALELYLENGIMDTMFSFSLAMV